MSSECKYIQEIPRADYLAVIFIENWRLRLARSFNR